MNAPVALAIVNAAISRTGGNTITAFNDGSVEANLANANYEQVVETELEAAPWRFARKTAAATLVVDVDDVPIPPLDSAYSFAYTLPSDLLMLRTLILGGGTPGMGGIVIEDYEIDEAGDVLCNFDASSPVLAVYTYRADESLWPSDFVEGVTRRIEALYLRADDRGQQATDGDNRSDRALARARLDHAQEEAPHDPRRSPLIQARTIGARAIRT